MKRFFKIVILIISLTLFFSACAKTEDEKLYKSAATELNELLEQYEAISAPQRHFMDEKGRVIVSIDNKGRYEFVEKNKEKLLSLANRFEYIAKTYPKSKWLDDTLFCLIFFSRLDAKENSALRNIGVDSLKSLVYYHPSFKLKNWTIKTFNESALRKTQILMEQELPDASFDERLRASLKLGLAMELQREGKIEESDNIFKDLLTKYSGTSFEYFVRSASRRTFTGMTEIRHELNNLRPLDAVK
jgi:hypothetical protein